MGMMKEEFITVQQAAAAKGVGVTTIYRAIERGALVAFEKFGRKVLRPGDVEAYQPATYGKNIRARRPRGPKKGFKKGAGDDQGQPSA